VTVEALHPGRVLRQALLLWAVAFAAIVVVSVLAPPPWAKVTAVVAFLYLPLAAMRRTGEDARDYGVTLAEWPLDVLLALGMLAVIAPLFVVGSLEFVGPFERDGWRPAGTIVPLVYVAWSLWLLVLGVSLIVSA
jgi:hypothetical protein